MFLSVHLAAASYIFIRCALKKEEQQDTAAVVGKEKSDGQKES